MNDERERRPVPQKRKPISRKREYRQADLGDLRRWMITDLCRFYRMADFVRDENETEDSWVFSLVTASRKYNVAARVARESQDGDCGSLSCVAETEGESRELTSGPLADYVWEEIVRDIISLEIVPTSDVKPVDRSPAQVPFATPEMIEMLGTIPKIAGGEDADNEEEADDEVLNEP